MTKTSGILTCLLAGLTSFVLPACSGSNDSGPSKADQCKALYTAECDKAYECLTPDELAQATDTFGTSKADCIAKVQAANPCDTVTECPAGETYDSAQATKCTNALSGVTCATFTDPNGEAPPECSNVCKASTGTSTSAMDGITECKKRYATECKKIFACFTPTELSAAADSVGTTPAECETMIEAGEPCVADQCGGGTFDGAQAEKCISALDALSCPDFVGLGTTTDDPAECSTVCK